MAIAYKKGNIFDSQADAIVIPVNCVGIMGAGLALQAKLKYPGVNDIYKYACKTGNVKIGKTTIINFINANKTLIMFPTKKRWQDRSRLDWVAWGLEEFIQSNKYSIYKSIAFPLLGCGLGGLDKRDVIPLMTKYLERLDINIEIWSNEEICSGRSDISSR